MKSAVYKARGKGLITLRESKMASGEKLILEFKVTETSHDRQYWVSRPYDSDPNTRAQTQSADVLLYPWEQFREQNDLFPAGTTEFFKYLGRELPHQAIAVAMDEDKYQEISLHAHEFRLPSLFIKEALVAIVVSTCTEYLLHRHAHPINDIAQLEIIIEAPSRPCIKVSYKGPVGQLTDRILDEVKSYISNSTKVSSKQSKRKANAKKGSAKKQHRNR